MFIAYGWPIRLRYPYCILEYLLECHANIINWKNKGKPRNRNNLHGLLSSLRRDWQDWLRDISAFHAFVAFFVIFKKKMIKPNSHLFPLENNTIHTCIKKKPSSDIFMRFSKRYISKIKKLVMDIKIKTVSNFLHLIILHIGAHITLEQIKGVVGTTIRSLCFLLVWLFVTEVYFLYPECNTVIILSRDTCKFWRGPGSCYWMTRMFWWIVHLLSMIDFFLGGLRFL